MDDGNEARYALLPKSHVVVLIPALLSPRRVFPSFLPRVFPALRRPFSKQLRHSGIYAEHK